MQKKDVEDDDRRSVVLPGAVAIDFEKYLRWANESGKLMPGRLGTAAFVAFWNLSPLEQMDMIQRAASYEHEEMARGSVVPNQSRQMLVREMHGHLVPDEGRAQSLAATTGQNNRHSGAP